MIRTVFLSLLLITGCTTTDAPQQINNAYFDELFDAEFFDNSADPFQEMYRVTTELSGQSDNPITYNNAFNVWYWEKYGRYMPNKIHYREEAGVLLIVFDIIDGEKANANLRINDDVLHVTGELILKKRRFEQMRRLDQKLPLPPGLDPLSTIAWSAGDKYNIRIEKFDN